MTVSATDQTMTFSANERKTMKRVVVDHYGGPEVLRVVEDDVPEPGPGEVRVRVLAAGVSFTDSQLRAGTYLGVPKPPFTPGYEFVGVVEKLGPGCSRLKVGDRVAVLTVWGAYAERACVPEGEAFEVPKDLDPAEVVSLPLTYVTAYQVIYREAKAKEGETVLVHGAAGRVGTAVLELGALAGLRLYGTCAARDRAAVERLGAVAIDYQNEDFVARGELMDSVYLCNKYGLPIYHDGWLELTRNLEWLIDHWDQPDEGIWETLGGRRDYTYSRLMSWVAVERAIRIARQRGLPADLPRWSAVRDRIYNQIVERGWHPGRKAFVQHYDSDVLDASLLLMPLCKFIAPTDPRWISTLDAITAELVSDSLVYRYNVDASPDGLAGEEATFSLCSFWWVEALARAGRLDEAQLAFEKMLTYANHVGLYSEQIGPTGEQLGNFPQAFTHLALISAAYNLDRQLG